MDGGSYGGIYVPNIATVIQEGNRAVASGKGQPGAKKLNLESLMVHNPISVSFFQEFHKFIDQDSLLGSILAFSVVASISLRVSQRI